MLLQLGFFSKGIEKILTFSFGKPRESQEQIAAQKIAAQQIAAQQI